MTHLPKKLLILGAVACVLGSAQTAAAAVQPAGTGEPLYTNSAQNTQWFEWPSTSGIGGYKVRYDFYENNTLAANPTVDPSPNGATSQWANWSGVRTLQHGGQYGVCAQGYYRFPNDSLWIGDGPNSCSMGTALGRRAYTTIDRSKPTTAIAVAGGAAATKDPKIPVQVNFSDDVAGPFPANFMCFQSGGTTDICNKDGGFIFGYASACSIPGSGGKSTTFTCTADFGSGDNPAPDGPVWACVIAADAAIPDNPSGPNQSSSADKANLSDAKCDGVVLDRTAPQVSIQTGGTAKVGDLVAFGSQAGDATSGLAGGYEWSFGDNTGTAGGASVNHTFTQPGTYEVKVKVADAAGNQGTATKVVTVSGGSTPPPAGGGGGSTPPSGGGSTPPAGGGTTTPGGGATDGGDLDDEATGEDVDFEVSAPRKLKLAKGKLPITLSTDATGKVAVALVRNGRVLARGSKAIAAGTASYKLKLPRKAKAGRHTLKVTFKPTGGEAITESLKVKLTGKRKAGAATASTARAAKRRVSAAGAPSGLPNGAFHGASRKRTFAPRAKVAA
jgi:PKD domain